MRRETFSVLRMSMTGIFLYTGKVSLSKIHAQLGAYTQRNSGLFPEIRDYPMTSPFDFGAINDLFIHSSGK